MTISVMESKEVLGIRYTSYKCIFSSVCEKFKMNYEEQSIEHLFYLCMVKLNGVVCSWKLKTLHSTKLKSHEGQLPISPSAIICNSLQCVVDHTYSSSV